MEQFNQIINQIGSGPLYLTGALVLLYWVAKVLIYRIIDRSIKESEVERVVAKNRVRDWGRLFLIVLIALLWFSQIQGVVVSLLVFATAIVLAFKEIIMCFTGGLLISMNKLFKIGDRIEVDGIRGYVLEKKLTSTKVLELGKERNSQQTTGSVLGIPNSLFLTKTVINQSYFKGYSIRSFTFSKLKTKTWQETEEILLELANDLCKDYLDDAKESIAKSCRKEGIIIPDMDPQVKVILSESNEVHLLLKMPVLNGRVAAIEQSLIREFLKH